MADPGPDFPSVKAGLGAVQVSGYSKRACIPQNRRQCAVKCPTSKDPSPY